MVLCILIMQITDHPSTAEGTVSETCHYAVCGTRKSGRKPCSKILRLNSFKFQDKNDALAFFCCVEHAILYAARLSKSKVSTLIKGGKTQAEKGKDKQDDEESTEVSSEVKKVKDNNE